MFKKRLLLQALLLSLTGMGPASTWAETNPADNNADAAPANPENTPANDFWSSDLGQDGAQRGVASWYGRRFHGRRTASGEVFKSNELTAAHRTLPLFSYARVTLLRTGKSVVVRVNDRGPHILTHRVIDLSQAAAAEIGLLALGTAEVLVERVLAHNDEGIPPAPPSLQLPLWNR